MKKIFGGGAAFFDGTDLAPALFRDWLSPISHQLPMDTSKQVKFLRPKSMMCSGGPLSLCSSLTLPCFLHSTRTMFFEIAKSWSSLLPSCGLPLLTVQLSLLVDINECHDLCVQIPPSLLFLGSTYMTMALITHSPP